MCSLQVQEAPPKLNILHTKTKQSTNNLSCYNLRLSELLLSAAQHNFHVSLYLFVFLQFLLSYRNVQLKAKQICFINELVLDLSNGEDNGKG